MEDSEIKKAINRIEKNIDVKETGSKVKKHTRPPWDEYFMQITELVAKRSTCLRRSTASLLVKNRQILATGYNGPPKGVPHCGEKGGCLREKLGVPSGQRQELCRAAHGESNCIAQAAAHGVKTEGATLYSLTFPCVFCIKMLINAGIKKIVFKDDYGSTEDYKLARELVEEAGIEVVRFQPS
ncbi:MAG: cytidine deaminase [Candidatus Aenigmarchaeota archaeon]|nr:cytidine deaminase [Candidatus Aenigmarchaeota archaeon]